jgi:hypothetical protein
VRDDRAEEAEQAAETPAPSRISCGREPSEAATSSQRARRSSGRIRKAARRPPAAK